MSRLYRGERYSVLRAKLPSNLVVFDGKCRMSQSRAAQVIERNFPLILDESFQPRCLLFTSRHLPEGREVLRAFPHLVAGATVKGNQPHGGKAPSSTSFSSSLSSSSSSSGSAFIDSVVLVERVPSAAGRMRRMNPFRSLGSMELDEPVAETDDLLVHTKLKAVCRIVSKLDRFWWSLLGRVGYYAIPQWLGDIIYDRIARRRVFWGTDEHDCVTRPDAIMGLKERTWTPAAWAARRRGQKPPPAVPLVMGLAERIEEREAVGRASARTTSYKNPLAPRLK